MSSHTDIVDAYMEGFRRSDKPGILALLTDDVAWDLPGFRHLTGKANFVFQPPVRGEPDAGR